MVPLYGSSFCLVFFLVKVVGRVWTIQFSMILLVFEWEQVAATIYYHMYLHHEGKYLEVDFIGSKATNRKPTKKKFAFTRGFNPRP